MSVQTPATYLSEYEKSEFAGGMEDTTRGGSAGMLCCKRLQQEWDYTGRPRRVGGEMQKLTCRGVANNFEE
jgi:hypothetical protein